jgi:hypothetical protein
VVDRLVEQQQVAALQHQHPQRQSRAFAIAQAATGREYIVAGEQEKVEEMPRFVSPSEATFCTVCKASGSNPKTLAPGKSNLFAHWLPDG